MIGSMSHPQVRPLDRPRAGGPTLPLPEPLLERLLSLLELRPDDLLVQLGPASRPDWLLPLTKLVPLRYQVLVVDPSQEPWGAYALAPDLRFVAMEPLRFAAFPMQCDRILLEYGLLHGAGARSWPRGCLTSFRRPAGSWQSEPPERRDPPRTASRRCWAGSDQGPTRRGAARRTARRARPGAEGGHGRLIRGLAPVSRLGNTRFRRLRHRPQAHHSVDAGMGRGGAVMIECAWCLDVDGREAGARLAGNQLWNLRRVLRGDVRGRAAVGGRLRGSDRRGADRAEAKGRPLGGRSPGAAKLPARRSRRD